jgi:4-carboxymuconolactone decarboxylase
MNPPRYQELSRAERDAAQQAVFDAIASSRGVVATPFHVLLENPDLAQAIQAVGAICRYRTGLSPRLSELAILVTAMHWQSEYEFAFHIPEARKAGVPEHEIAALAERRKPDFADGDAALLYEFVNRFFVERDVPDALFEAACARFGRRTTVELASLMGYYSLLAIVLKIFRVPADK